MKVKLLADGRVIDAPDMYANRLIEQGKAVLYLPPKPAKAKPKAAKQDA